MEHLYFLLTFARSLEIYRDKILTYNLIIVDNLIKKKINWKIYVFFCVIY